MSEEPGEKFCPSGGETISPLLRGGFGWWCEAERRFVAAAELVDRIESALVHEGGKPAPDSARTVRRVTPAGNGVAWLSQAEAAKRLVAAIDTEFGGCASRAGGDPRLAATPASSTGDSWETSPASPRANVRGAPVGRRMSAADGRASPWRITEYGITRRGPEGFIEAIGAYQAGDYVLVSIAANALSLSVALTPEDFRAALRALARAGGLTEPEFRAATGLGGPAGAAA